MTQIEQITSYKDVFNKFLKRCNDSERSFCVGKDDKVRFTIDGNFTVAVITDGATGKVVSVGASKRMPTDKENIDVGKTIAIWRALQDAHTR